MKASGSLALIHTQFGPYHFARTDALTETYSGQVYPIQLASKEALRDWNASPTSQIATIATGTLEKLAPQQLAKDLINYLNHLQPRVVIIAGYQYPAMRSAALWARENSAATILLSDSQYIDRPRNLIKERLKGTWLCKNFDAAFVAGSRASSYLEKLGFPVDRIWRGYDVVDNQYFTKQAEVVRQNNQVQTQREITPPYFLYVGRFSPEKNLLRLLDAYAQYCQRLKQAAFSLVLVGDGPQREELKAKVEQLRLSKVHFPGFKQISELPNYYASASAFILPSISEPWGLVINEAMASQLPLLVSDRCGCIPDLVFPGINGYVFNPFNVNSLADRMLYLSAQSEEKRYQMGQESLRIIQNFTPRTWATALVDCTEWTSQKLHLSGGIL